MTQLSPKIFGMLKEMAELRATTMSWEKIAARIGRCERTCRRWRVAFAEEWGYLLREAQRARIGEIGDQAMIILQRIVQG